MSLARWFLKPVRLTVSPQRHKEPAKGVEPSTTCLQNRCSTIELHWLMKTVCLPIIQPFPYLKRHLTAGVTVILLQNP